MTTHIVTRSFRGASLVLASVHAGSGMHWTADRSAAIRMSLTDAMALVAKAARVWGADCAAVDAIGQLTQPAAAVMPRPFASHAEILRVNARLEALRDSEDDDACTAFGRRYLEPRGYDTASWDAAVSAARAAREVATNG